MDLDHVNLVKKLREYTGISIMECKKFLIESKWDFKKAINNIYKYSENKVINKSIKKTKEGVIVISRSEDCKSAVILEVNSETDFVIRNAYFMHFVMKVADTALFIPKVFSVMDLNSENLLGESITVEQGKKNLILKLGENIELNRLNKIVCKSSDHRIGYYLHGFRIGVLVHLNGGDDLIAKNIAMHIAACNPMVISKDQFSVKMISKKRKLFLEQSKKHDKNKSDDIYNKIVSGKLNKFIRDNSLLEQVYIKDNNLKVNDYLRENHVTVLSFIRFEVGNYGFM
ncbi:translation elongation factor Ts [Candidatus Legionella polyplacis]|uniref:Elongation factor Ts n=1 Tax=Candidatus Legionella polyplacis TaxID=2005262 RepID=A0ABZ2GXJ1_9GAMM|nr:translation elongation factor Ts [Candidatus Legionella polyplacis]ATW01999.1 translation elongation factor Ts [Candidatus Legionella polyplacis]